MLITINKKMNPNVEEATVIADLGKGTLYYYRGNFFYPVSPANYVLGVMRKAIREFYKENKVQIDAYRARPDYISYAQLLDMQHSSTQKAEA